MAAIQETKIIFKCDNPKCDHPGFSFIQEETAKRIEALPDDYFRVIEFRHWDEKAKEFVVKSLHGISCLRTLLKSYIEPRSPRELSEQMQRNAEVDARHHRVRPDPAPSEVTEKDTSQSCVGTNPPESGTVSLEQIAKDQESQ
jgi:hypothetical protein